MGQRGILRPAAHGGDEADDKVGLLEFEAVVFMIVGPHSGFSLPEIFKMKAEEDKRLGFFYWGYAGSLCRPQRVQDFAASSLLLRGQLPKLAMVETRARYLSKTVGRIRRWSADGKDFHIIPKGVTLIGCTAAVTCANLQQCDHRFDMNRYLVANGRRVGTPLGHYVRYQVNKACAFSSPGDQAVPSRLVRVVAVADLVAPYCVHLAM